MMDVSHEFTAPRRRPRRYTQGASLVVVVLFTLLILSMVIAATLRLSLSTRVTSTDQKSTLQAQYSAESNLALMRSQIRDMQTLLSKDGIAVVDSSLTNTQLDTLALTFCGSSWNNVSSDPVKSSDFTDLDTNDTTSWATYSANGNIIRKCTFSNSGSSSQYALLGTITAKTATSPIEVSIPSSEQPSDTSVSGLSTWWSKKLATPITVGSGSYTILPLKILKLDANNYRFYFKVSALMSASSTSIGSRTISGAPTSSAIWWFQISKPSLLNNVLMTNHHKSTAAASSSTPDVNFIGTQVFDGDVFTNEKFLFANSSKATFKGSVASAGCTDLPTSGTTTNSNGDCSHTAGVWINSGRIGLIVPSNNVSGWSISNPLLDTQKKNFNASLLSNVNYYTNSNVTWSSAPDFTAAYKALPSNANNQQSMATAAGLLMPSSVTGIYIFAGDSSGNSFSSSNASYSTTASAWNEPSITYQYIEYVNNSGNIDTSNMYRIDSSGYIYKYNATNSKWATSPTTSTPFNGVIYYPSTSTVLNIYGPSRLNSDTTGNLAKEPPALASFSNISITAADGVNINTDLVMSNSPCANDTSSAGTCSKTTTPQNVLGIFASKGNVAIGTAAPNNVDIQAALMASGTSSTDGQVTVTNYDSGNDRGNATIIGSVIENYYGAFGTSSPTGYQRDFHFDPRFKSGVTPRGFPVSPTWTPYDANHNMNNSSDSVDLSDIIWRQGS